MKPCISQATTMSSSFAEDVEAYAAAGWPALEIWLTKLETHLEQHCVADTRKLLADRQLVAAAASYQGGLLWSQGAARHAHFEHFKRRLDLCQQFDIRTLLLVPDFARTLERTDLERAVVSLKQAAQWAAGFHVRLALEFRGADAFCASLASALQLIESSGEPNVGVNFDVFHYYKGPSKFEDLDLLTTSNLAFVQVSDVSGVPRELMADADRVLPGDGDFQLEPLLHKLRETGYDGYVSLELLNPVLWQMKPSQVAELGRAALQRSLEEAATRRTVTRP